MRHNSDNNELSEINGILKIFKTQKYYDRYRIYERSPQGGLPGL